VTGAGAARAPTAAEIVIIGGGLAGLAAAHMLRDRDVVLLEQTPRLGGRVCTFADPRANVDLGACFAVRPMVLPSDTVEPESGSRILERGPIAIRHRGRLHMAATAWDCVETMRLGPGCRDALTGFRDGRIAADALPDEALEVVDALFKQIHPGDVRDYIPERQRDALHDFYPDHFERGNGFAISAYGAALGDRAKLALGHVAVAIEERADGARVAYRTSDLARRGWIDCRAVIVATPADVARTLVRGAHAAGMAFLEAVRYGTYTVVALRVDAPRLPEFRLLVTTDEALDVVVQQGAADRVQRTLLCYYADPMAAAAAAMGSA
jgi:hypothetical protein